MSCQAPRFPQSPLPVCQAFGLRPFVTGVDRFPQPPLATCHAAGARLPQSPDACCQLERLPHTPVASCQDRLSIPS